MHWVSILWSVSIGSCLTLGIMHLLVWIKSHAAMAHLAFTAAATGAAGVAAAELMLTGAGGPEQYGEILRWAHIPVAVMLCSLVGFTGLYFRTGRAWLGWAGAGIRLLCVVINFTIPVNLNYREITALRTIDFLGEPVTIVARATANPLNALGHLGSLLIVLFVVDASFRLWKRGGCNNRRKALVVGGAVALFVTLATVHSVLVRDGRIESPYLISFFYLGIIAAMAHELSHDVISAARLSNELHESQQQMTLAATAARMALWTWDIPHDRIWVTQEGRGIYGVSPDEKINVARFLQTLHPDDRERVRLAMNRAQASGGPFAEDYRVLLADGTVRWISARGSMEMNEGHGPLRMRGVSMDNTEWKQAEEQSKQVVEAAPYAMIMVDAAAGIVLANRQAEITFGYGREEMLGRPIELLIPQRFRGHHPAQHQSFFHNPSARAMGAGRELFGLRKDGTELPIEVGLNPIHTSSGTFVLASVIDITERRRIEREALEQRDELFHLSRVASLGQLSGSLAHELNQPLGIILSNAQAAQRMLAGANPDIAELREILTDIIGEDRRAGEVITRLRALLKRGETRLLPIDINKVITDVQYLLRSDLISRSVTIQTDLATGLPDVEGDQVQLQQVLLNLFTNACDAMAEIPQADRILRITTSLQADKVCVSVADRGCGLPDGDTSRIFQPFVTTKTHGLGIGLAICRSIIAAHHGRLWAESDPGGGTTFHLELKITDPPSHESPKSHGLHTG